MYGDMVLPHMQHDPSTAQRRAHLRNSIVSKPQHVADILATLPDSDLRSCREVRGAAKLIGVYKYHGSR